MICFPLGYPTIVEPMTDEQFWVIETAGHNPASHAAAND
jgi:hypothetical protein